MERLPGSDYQCSRQKEPSDERKTQGKEQLAISASWEELDGDKEGEETLTSQMNAMLGLCAVCHLTVSSSGYGANENVPCSKEHTLCHRCLQHFPVRSDSGCVLCRAESQRSNTSFSPESNASLNSVYQRAKRTQEFTPQQPQRYLNYHQRVPLNEVSHIKPWIQNNATIASTEQNELSGRDVDSLEMDCYRGKTRNAAAQEENVTSDQNRLQRQSYCSLARRENYASELKINGQIGTECSRRPIHCPRIDCAINVAFSALTHHFLFDHPEVPILSVEPGTKSTLIVSFGALSSNSSRCLALLLVSGKLSDPAARLFNGNQINPKYRNRLPLPVLAARLHCRNRYISSKKLTNDEEEYCEKDVIIAWVAGLDIGNTTDRLRCSIQAVDSIDNAGLRSLTYTGPVNSLRTAQCPRDVFSTGDCIVLHEGLLGHITSDCTNLNVNVIVH